MRYLIAGLLALTPSLALADTLDKSDSAWILTATALVLFMTLPFIAEIYRFVIELGVQGSELILRGIGGV